MPRKKLGNDAQEKCNGKDLGRRLRLLRCENGISIRRLAEKVGVSDVYISQLERGEKLPSFDTLICILNALNTTPNQMLCDYVTADCGVIASNISSMLGKLTVSEQYAAERFLALYIEEIRERAIKS